MPPRRVRRGARVVSLFGRLVTCEDEAEPPRELRRRAPFWQGARRAAPDGERLWSSSPHIWSCASSSRLERFGFKGAGARSEQNLDAEAHKTLRRTHPRRSRTPWAGIVDPFTTSTLARQLRCPHFAASFVRMGTYVRDLPASRACPLPPGIERRPLWLAEDAARELPDLSLADALQLVHLYAERGSPKFEPAARRWLVRYLTEGTPSIRDVATVTASLEKYRA